MVDRERAAEARITSALGPTGVEGLLDGFGGPLNIPMGDSSGGSGAAGTVTIIDLPTAK